MQCPSCNHHNTKVLESRSTEKGQSIRRRRECLNCNYRFTTYERIEFIPMAVIKKDGNKESFDRSKLLRGIVRACEKTGVAMKTLELIVDDIESELEERGHREVTSHYLGKLVLNALRRVSEVAYIRFASVYGNFTSIEDFVATLQKLQKETETSKNNQEINFLDSQVEELKNTPSIGAARKHRVLGKARDKDLMFG